jgi:hypothetical protein
MRTLLMMPLALLLAAPAQARSLTVEQTVALAMEQDLTIEAAEAAEIAAEAEAQKALLALFPSLSSSAGWTRLGEVPYVEFDTSAMFGGGDTGGNACEDISEDDLPPGFTLEMAQAMCEMIMGWMAPDTSAGPVVIEMGLQNNYFAQLTLEQVLFAGGAMHQARRATKDFHRASVEGVRYAEHAAAYTAEQLFYGVVMARQAAELTQQAHELVRAYEATLQNMVDAGVASRADLLATQAQASQAQLDAMKAAHGARLAETTLKATLRLPMDEPLELVLDDDYPSTLPAERERLLDTALRRRPEINQLGYSLDGMDHLASAAWASWLPAVVVQGMPSSRSGIAPPRSPSPPPGPSGTRALACSATRSPRPTGPSSAPSANSSSACSRSRSRWRCPASTSPSPSWRSPRSASSRPRSPCASSRTVSSRAWSTTPSCWPRRPRSPERGSRCCRPRPESTWPTPACASPWVTIQR